MCKLVILLGLAACSATMRAPATYRDDTAKLLETRQPVVKRCYDDALAADPSLQATITVSFVVEKQTGAIRQAAVVPEQSTGSDKLYACVLNALADLRLDPGDRNEARATFVYQLKPS